MVAGDGREQWELERTTRAASEARMRVDRHREALGEDAWRRARLLASELATNAVRHGAGRIELSLQVTEAGLRVCVRDEGGARPAPRTPGTDGGLGLHLVAGLSNRWGHEDAGAVWFEVDRGSVV